MKAAKRDQSKTGGAKDKGGLTPRSGNGGKGKAIDNKKKREDKGQRKKGQPKWKNVVAEVESIKARIEKEVPPSGVLYYKYKAKDEAANTEEKKEKPRTIANKNIQETDDKNKVKIRFSDMPISKASVSGLFKAKFVKLTDVQRAAIPHAIAGETWWSAQGQARERPSATFSLSLRDFTRNAGHAWTASEPCLSFLLVSLPSRPLKC